jgi:hypothetical protein
LLLLGAGPAFAEEKTDDLRATLAAQAKELEALQQEVDEQAARSKEVNADGDQNNDKQLDPDAVKKIVAGYLKDNPGAGMPNSVQTGYKLGQGFSIASAPDPVYKNWDDDSRIPFELRFRGRIMMGYVGYKVTDRVNHQTNLPATQTNLTGIPGGSLNAVRLADLSQLEVKRLNMIWQGNVFDPNLRYLFEFLGHTRGLPGEQNNKVVQTLPAGGAAPNTAAISPIGGGVTLDNAVTLFQAFIAYDWHPCWGEKGCSPDCADGLYKYSPTVTFFVGKIKPFFGLDEFLGNGNQQFCDFAMADWMFDADDDTRLMAAGFTVKAFDDRLFVWSSATNGSEGTLQPNSQMDNLPGFIGAFWYDFGGKFNCEKKVWELYGDCPSDIDYSCCPVVRAGGGVNIVPLGRRSLYGDAEQSRYFTMPGAPGGTRLINELNGGVGSLIPGAHDVDMFDAYTYNAFIGGKYHGFSFLNEWWLRNLDNFRTTPNGLGNIIYQSTLGPGGTLANALFPNHGLIDYGTSLAAGYFIVPKKLELVARWSMVRGQSGDINGNGKFFLTAVPGVVGPVQVVSGAFRQYHEADEYTIGVNYFFKRHALKWQTDFSIYNGGNPAPNGGGVAGFITGADGYMLRTQMQLFF